MKGICIPIVKANGTVLGAGIFALAYPVSLTMPFATHIADSAPLMAGCSHYDTLGNLKATSAVVATIFKVIFVIFVANVDTIYALIFAVEQECVKAPAIDINSADILSNSVKCNVLFHISID